jgi:predicted metal-dependent RNase
VGYSDPETPAGKIKAASHGDLVNLRAKGGQAYPLKCRVECFDFSGHATRSALIDYARTLNPKKVLLVHGDEPALESLSQALREVMPGTDIIVPEPGKPVVLD